MHTHSHARFKSVVFMLWPHPHSGVYPSLPFTSSMTGCKAPQSASLRALSCKSLQLRALGCQPCPPAFHPLQEYVPGGSSRPPRASSAPRHRNLSATAGEGRRVSDEVAAGGASSPYWGTSTMPTSSPGRSVGAGVGGCTALLDHHHHHHEHHHQQPPPEHMCPCVPACCGSSHCCMLGGILRVP